MFHSAALKLTAWYLGIIMVVSIVFSVALYHVADNDLGRNVNRQVSYYNGFLSNFDLNNYSQIRQRQLDEDRTHLRDSLIALNLMFFVLGGVASYALARRTLEPIEIALDAQKRFASDASHELRTPLAAMQSEIEVALRDPKLTKSDAIALLGSSLEEVGKLRNLSEGLLKLASQSSQLQPDQMVSLKVVAAQAAERLSKVAETKKIKLIQNLKNVNVRGDQSYLADLTAIFLDNAIKYSSSGSEVILSTGRSRKQGFVRVQDYGQGIKANDLPHIFDRFYRADPSRTKGQASGYGLGLALAKKIADLHGGHIEVQSALGKGSTFTFYLSAA